MSDTPDTRTPSAEGCGQRECGHGKRAVLDRRYGWLHVRTGVGCEKPPSVPNRAPTDEALAADRDALVERLRARARLGNDLDAGLHGEAADALEDLTSENERLRAELAEIAEFLDHHDDEGYYPLINGVRDLEDSRATWAEAAERARRQVAAVRARCEEWESYPEGSEHRIAARWLRAALDTASEDRGDSQE